MTLDSPAILPADEAGIRTAAERVRTGGIVVYPTETVYGIGADPFNARALDRVFEIKGRDREKGLILLIPGPEDVESLAAHVPPIARPLMRAFWPGPLTLVFRARPGLPPALLGGRPTVALRVSSAPCVSGLLSGLGRPITSTSANRSGVPPARSAAEAARDLGGLVDLVIDGGLSADDRPSTVVDVSAGKADILRTGRISPDEIHRILKHRIPG